MGERLEGDQRPRPPNTGDVVPSLLKMERPLALDRFYPALLSRQYKIKTWVWKKQREEKNILMVNGVEVGEAGERDSDQADTGYLLLFVSPYLTSQEEGEGFVRQGCYLLRAAGSSRVPMAVSLWADPVLALRWVTGLWGVQVAAGRRRAHMSREVIRRGLQGRRDDADEF